MSCFGGAEEVKGKGWGRRGRRRFAAAAPVLDLSCKSMRGERNQWERKGGGEEIEGEWREAWEVHRQVKSSGRGGPCPNGKEG